MCRHVTIKPCMKTIDYVNSIFDFSFERLLLSSSIRTDECGFTSCSADNYLNGCLLLNRTATNSSNDKVSSNKEIHEMSERHCLSDRATFLYACPCDVCKVFR